MDADQRKALKAQVDGMMRLRLALDDLAERVEQLEAQLPAPRSFERAELDRQKKAAVRSARKRGLSIAMIASAYGIGRNTVATILAGEQVAEPAKVRGLDGKMHPARHAETHRNGSRPAA